MKRRWMTLSGALALCWVGMQGVTACASDGRGGTDEQRGTIALPLGAYASSGTRYRLRDATFVLENPYNDGYSGEG